MMDSTDLGALLDRAERVSRKVQDYEGVAESGVDPRDYAFDALMADPARSDDDVARAVAMQIAYA